MTTNEHTSLRDLFADNAEHMMERILAHLRNGEATEEMVMAARRVEQALLDLTHDLGVPQEG